MPLDLRERWGCIYGCFGKSVRFGRLWQTHKPLSLKISSEPSSPGHYHHIRDHAFANCYTEIDPHFARFVEDETPVPRLVGSANGIILELGPGSGNQIPRFSSSVISKIYAVEPNANFIPTLLQKAKDHGFEGKYIVVNAALEDQDVLTVYGIVEGSVDTVVCIQVLCSVPDARAAAKRIWKVLKPGGQLVYWEHMGSSDGVTRFFQRMWNLIRKPLMGGCYLNRDIEDVVMNAGAWKIVEMGRDGDDGYDLMPRYCGRLRKPIE